MAAGGSRVALVTGAGGSAVSQRLETRGFQVFRADRTAGAAVTPCDVTDEDSIRQLVDGLRQRHDRLDVLVNCAGVIDVAPVERMSRRQWERVIEVNLTGAFLVTRGVLPLLYASDAGRIIHIASDAGKTGEPWIAHYAASKFGLIGFTQSLALELATTSVTANCVCPVICETGMTDQLARDLAAASGEGDESTWRERFIAEIPAGRACRPADVAAVVDFLAAAESSFVTGQAINVSGGHELN